MMIMIIRFWHDDAVTNEATVVKRYAISAWSQQAFDEYSHMTGTEILDECHIPLPDQEIMLNVTRETTEWCYVGMTIEQLWKLTDTVEPHQ